MQSINNHNVDREILLRLIFSDVDTYIIGENKNKYIIFALTENNKIVLELTKNFGVKFKNELSQ